MNVALRPQSLASNPKASVFVAANAGAGKTSTLVRRVARLLLAGSRPEAILCVTYTRAAAVEMQRRLFETLGEWAVAGDEPLRKALAGIDEAGRSFSAARALFARALETPGGLKIQTIHAFCEKLLRRFPLEAGVSPGFTVLEDAAAAEISAAARDAVANLAAANPQGAVARAYAHFSVELDWLSFNAMFATFEARRSAIAAWVADCELRGGYVIETWRLCGFTREESSVEIVADALAGVRWRRWKAAAAALSASAAVTDQRLGAAMDAAATAATYELVSGVFFTSVGEPRKQLGTARIDAAVRAWLAEEQDRLVRVRQRLAAAKIAEDTIGALTLATAYAGFYETAKLGRSALDFGDLVACANALLTRKSDALWVLYKLDGGLEHILLDEAQDTSAEQWEILRALTGEFFSGRGAAVFQRTIFAVGDEKQSIFSFQGAAPERLATETQRFASMASAAGLAFSQVRLRESWRSTEEVLSMVDAVFLPPPMLAGLLPAAGDNVLGFVLSHTAKRGPGGSVELWPMEVSQPGPEPDVWAPVDAVPPTNATRLLASRIARSIAGMVARGERVVDRETGQARPCRFGDVLILVRRRSGLFHEIIRALKSAGVPVAGADRLKLSEHGVFQDLMALGRIACFPADDLTLAALLRSPFCELNEDSLFDLAFGRSGSLWTTLVGRAPERPEWRAAVERLDWARAEAGRLTPLDFYLRFLSRLDAAGRSMRQRLITRLGVEGEDALEAFLAQAAAAENRGHRQLETFLAAMAVNDMEIKREADQPSGKGLGEVRVMTTHGAKGLEAPVVILPDTTTRATAQSGPLLGDETDGFLWAPRKADDCPASTAAREKRELAAEHETARLLYVALTRARDRLIVCGVESQPSRFERSWYDAVSRAFEAKTTQPFAFDEGGGGLRFGSDPVSARSEASNETAAPIALPAWAARLAAAEPARWRYASPSSLARSTPDAAPSPLAAVGGLGRFRRGDLIHRLLQRLPDIPSPERLAATTALLAREPDLSPDQRTEIAAAALGVLGDQRFAGVFGPGSRPEVALMGGSPHLPPGLAISGRVDRLLVEPRRVLVVDFKTNRPAPARIEDADPAYILQMALYAEVLADIYPGRHIEAALVWTDGPRLTPIPGGLMRQAVAGLEA